MIHRKALLCESCDGITLTRTAIGHRQRQTHRFPCPGCRIEIVYEILVDQDNIDFQYEEPRNARWLAGAEADAAEDKHLAVITFDSELLTRREGRFSPFMTDLWLFHDYHVFERDEVLRHTLRTKLWDSLRQLLSHFETGQDAAGEAYVWTVGVLVTVVDPCGPT